MTAENEIKSEVETLKARFSETKSLYREVCALLFFRHGITPTANMLYQYVRKGSMGVPAQALATFWEDLRQKTAVQIDHPGLPDALKPIAAEAIKGLWQAALEHSNAELSGIRIDLKNQSEQLAAEHLAMGDKLAAAERQVIDADSKTAAALRQVDELNTRLEDERRGHAATSALLTASQQQVRELQGQLERVRGDFSADLAQARQAVEAADERAAGAQRKALLEVEQERASRIKSDKALDAVRTQLAEVEGRLRDAAVKHAEEVTGLRAQAGAAEESAKRLQATLAERTEENGRLQDQLTAQREQVLQATAQAQATRDLLDQFRPEAASIARAKKPKAARTAP
ncbi:MAG: DNA-binding protein [Rhizobacter sp.]|nr:DNA-binding protein [Rhizobacter sp.]